MVWKGTARNDELSKLVPYGILMKNLGWSCEYVLSWSCEYVRRKYFFDLFQVNNPISGLFENNANSLPSELDLLQGQACSVSTGIN